MINLEGGIINLFSIELCLDCSYKNIVEFILNNGFDFMLDIQLLVFVFDISGLLVLRVNLVFFVEIIDVLFLGILSSSQKIKIIVKVKGLLLKLEDNLELISFLQWIEI